MFFQFLSPLRPTVPRAAAIVVSCDVALARVSTSSFGTTTIILSNRFHRGVSVFWSIWALTVTKLTSLTVLQFIKKSGDRCEVHVHGLFPPRHFSFSSLFSFRKPQEKKVLRRPPGRPTEGRWKTERRENKKKSLRHSGPACSWPGGSCLSHYSSLFLDCQCLARPGRRMSEKWAFLSRERPAAPSSSASDIG